MIETTTEVAQKFYCTNCGVTNDNEVDCCGSTMLSQGEAEGFGLSDFEPEGTNSLDVVDEWN